MSWSFFMKLFLSIDRWHHTGKKTRAEINNAPSAHVLLSKKGMPGPRGGTPKILISSNKPNIYLPSPVFSHGQQLYVAMSWVASSANIKIFSIQGPDGYMWNVIYREVLEM
jgi:hypothetical protein